MRVYPEVKGKYIIVRYLPICLSISRMLLEHYDTEEYANAVVFVNTEDTYEDGKALYPGKKLIYYQQEHLRTPTNWRLRCLARITKFDEIWELDYSNMAFYKNEHRTKLVFRPVRYFSYYEDKKIITKENPRFDLLFCGTLVGNRPALFSQMSYKFEFNKTMIVWGVTMDKIPDLLADCKFCLNLHQLNKDIQNQEQIRIFELLMMGKAVITEDSIINYFGDLVTEVTVDNILAMTSIADSSDKSERYKEMTYTDAAYERYCNNIRFSHRLISTPLDY